MEILDVLSGTVVFVEALENVEGIVGAGVGGEPAGGLGDDEEDYEHRDEEDTLQDTGDAPGEGGRVGLGESVINPVG